MWFISTQMWVFFFSFPLVNKSKESDRIQLAYEVRPAFLQKCRSLVGGENLKEIRLSGQVSVKLSPPPTVGVMSEG